MEQKQKIKIQLVLLTFIVSIFFNSVAFAATTVPQKFVYEGRLLDSSGTSAVTSSQAFRFSLWSASAVSAGDVVAGAIDTLAPNYGGWQEVQTVTPNSDGFFSFELGSGTALPAIDYTKHLYLQVEVKVAADPDTSYEVLDRAPSDLLVDRSPLGSVPYALNADLIDNADVGTSDGDVVLLGAGDQWSTSTVPGGTNEDGFTIDSNDDAAGTIDLQFGSTLSKMLSWDIGSGYFNFNDDVNINGDLTVTGMINGDVQITAIDGHYYSAGSLETAIDTLDEQVFTLSSSTVNQKIILPSIYEGVSYSADGADNIGRLYLDHDATNDRNYYVWTSTRSILQDYDVIIQVPVPNDFNSWNGATPWSFTYNSTNAATSENKADIYIYDTSGTLVSLTGSSTNLASTTWATTVLGFGGSPTFTPGETFLIAIKMSAKSKEGMHLGEIVLDYIQN